MMEEKFMQREKQERLEVRDLVILDHGPHKREQWKPEAWELDYG
jgi:hypothetical protein